MTGPREGGDDESPDSSPTAGGGDSPDSSSSGGGDSPDSSPTAGDGREDAHEVSAAGESGTEEADAGGRGEKSEQNDTEGQLWDAGQTDEATVTPAIRRRPGADEPETTEQVDAWKLLVRDVVTSVVAVMLVGGYLFAISGVFPPMVAVESGSMEPNMNVNDLVFVMDEDRFPPAAAQGESGVVTARTGREVSYDQFGGSGDVIIFAPRGNENQTPVIHRAMFWVSEDEDWYDRANSEYVGAADSCTELSGCPADHAGFITKGDNNPRYDQAGPGRLSEPIRPEWIIGTAEVRIPGLGWLRLRF